MTDAQMAASLTPWEFCVRLEQLEKVWIGRYRKVSSSSTSHLEAHAGFLLKNALLVQQKIIKIWPSGCYYAATKADTIF